MAAALYWPIRKAVSTEGRRPPGAPGGAAIQQPEGAVEHGVAVGGAQLAGVVHRRPARVGIQLLVGVGEGFGVTAEEALGFVLKRPAVTSVVVGTLSPAHLAANVAAAESALRG